MPGVLAAGRMLRRASTAEEVNVAAAGEKSQLLVGSKEHPSPATPEPCGMWANLLCLLMVLMVLDPAGWVLGVLLLCALT